MGYVRIHRLLKDTLGYNELHEDTLAMGYMKIKGH